MPESENYIPGTYRPPHLIADAEDLQEGSTPLSSRLVDGEIRVYRDNVDSGLRIGLDGTDGLVVRIDETVRLAKGDD